MRFTTLPPSSFTEAHIRKGLQPFRATFHFTLRKIGRFPTGKERRRYEEARQAVQAEQVQAERLPVHWGEHLQKLSSSFKRQQQAKWMASTKTINALEEQMQGLTTEELRNKTEEFRMRLQSGRDTLDSLLPEAFAVVREASRRVLNLRHFDVQLLGGMALHEGKITEIQTGEGKTLVATLPAYLNALTGKGVHIVTVNPYLAARDAHWMGGIFKSLGLTVGVATDHRPSPEVQAAFDADITYVTSSDLGWLYLTDNSSIEEVEQLSIRRPFNYAIVDEADSVLIDDAVQPLVISRAVTVKASGKAWELAHQVCRRAGWNSRDFAPKELRRDPALPDTTAVVRLWDKHEAWRLDEGGYVQGQLLVDAKHKRLVVTEEGFEKILEQLVQLGHVFEDAVQEGRAPVPGDLWGGEKPLGQYVQLALQAYLMQKDVDYLVRADRIVLLNQNTGRTLESSRWSHGIQQAVEVKEGLNPQQMDINFASTTYQMFFNLYPNLGGMTGTAATAEFEFAEMYNRAVEAIPPHKPRRRIDNPVEVFVDLPVTGGLSAKEKRLVGLLQESLRNRQPVLIGTHSVEESERWERLLMRLRVATQVLNAKPAAVEREALIIAQAGMPRTAPHGAPAVTIATSMAGRGTDIRLGGDAQGLTKTALRTLLLPILVDPQADREGWLMSRRETCPLNFWPADPSQNLEALRAFLPQPVLESLRQALKAVAVSFFELEDKVPLHQALAWMDSSFSQAEKLVPAFLSRARKELGELQDVPEARVFQALHAFCKDSGLPETASVARSALWLSVWLETSYCPQLAAEARAAGGLRVICTSMAPTHRVWDQLRGRSGRQGDPGDTFVLLSLFEDVQLDDDIERTMQPLLRYIGDGENSVPLSNSLAMRVILGPSMKMREGNARDTRSHIKSADEVLHGVRQQLYSSRRWLMSSTSRQLHAMIRTYCYGVAAAFVLQHVDPMVHPRKSEKWNVQQLLSDVWRFVNGRQEGRMGLEISYPIRDLFGVVMPQPGQVDEGLLRAPAQMLLRSLHDERVQPPPPGGAEDLDLRSLQEEMLQARRDFLASSGAVLNGRFKGQAMQLVDYLAVVLYIVLVGPKRESIKGIFKRLMPRSVTVFDSSCDPAPVALQGTQEVVDLEEMVQRWERKCLVRTMSELWVGMLADSQTAWEAANATSISHLTPLQEYTSSISRRFRQLLDDHRFFSLQKLFSGPRGDEFGTDPLEDFVRAPESAQPGSTKPDAQGSEEVAKPTGGWSGAAVPAGGDVHEGLRTDDSRPEPSLSGSRAR